MAEIEKYNLQTNPFRLTPSTPDEIIWAGFHDLQKRIARRISLAVKIPNSSLILNWGEYGSGKTHAANYFSKNDVLTKIVENNAIPFPLIIDFPRGSKEPVRDIFVSVIDKLDINDLKEKVNFDDDTFNKALIQSTNNIFIRNILKHMFREETKNEKNLFSSDKNVSNINDFKGYLYGTADIKQFMTKGIQRKLSTENDYTEFLAALFSLITYEKKCYSCVILWFDEFESINTLGNASLGNVNNFFRTLLDKTPNNLLVFLNLTQSPTMKVEELSVYLHSPVRSRIKERIELSIPNSEALKEYFIELINNPLVRIKETEDKYYPFDEVVVNNVIQDLGVSSSLRSYNEAFSLILDYAIEENEVINDQYYQKIKNEVIGWKD